MSVTWICVCDLGREFVLIHGQKREGEGGGRIGAWWIHGCTSSKKLDLWSVSDLYLCLCLG